MGSVSLPLAGWRYLDEPRAKKLPGVKEACCETVLKARAIVSEWGLKEDPFDYRCPRTSTGEKASSNTAIREVFRGLIPGLQASHDQLA